MPASPHTRATCPCPLLVRSTSRESASRSGARPMKTGHMTGAENDPTMRVHRLLIKCFKSRVEDLFACRLRRCILDFGADPDGLYIHKFLDAEGREFASIATTLDSSKGKARVCGGHAVNEDAASFDARCKLASPLNIA